MINKTREGEELRSCSAERKSISSGDKTNQTAKFEGDRGREKDRQKMKEMNNNT